VFLLNSHQDMRLRARVAATFSVFITTAFGISALVTAIQVNLSHAAAICAVVLSSETLLILRWWLRRTSA
jgi:hypothetical protein